MHLEPLWVLLALLLAALWLAVGAVVRLRAQRRRLEAQAEELRGEIAQRKAVERLLREREAGLNAILDNTDTIVFTLAPDGTILLTEGRGLERLTGPPGGGVGCNFLRTLPEREDLKEHFERCLAGQTVQAIVPHSRGKLQLLACPLRGEGGLVERVVGIFIDVTEAEAMRASLAESEARLRLIFENAPYAIVVSRVSDGSFLEANPVFLRVAGCTREQLPHIPPARFEGYTEEAALAWRRKAYEQGGIRGQEGTSLRPDGSKRHILFSSAPITVGGEPCLLSITIDVTDRKLMELALKESEEKYRAIFNNSPIGIFRTTFAGRFMEANPALARMLGYESREDLLANMGDLAHNLYPAPQERQRLLGALLDSPGEVTMEVEFKRKDGSAFLVIIHAALHLDEKGEPAWLDGTIEDISGRKRAEEQLKQSEEKFSKAFSLAPYSIAIISVDDGRILDANEAFEAQTGYSRQEYLGRNTKELNLWVDLEQRELFYANILNEGVLVDFEYLMRRKDGSVRNALHSVQRIDMAGGACFISLVRDITEMKLVQQAMVQSEKMTSLGGLAAGMAHEINNPLGIIFQSVMGVQRRLDPHLPANGKEAQALGVDLENVQEYMRRRNILRYMDGIREATERAAEIVRHMLNFSRRSDSGMAPQDVMAMVRSSVSLAEKDYDLKKKYDFRQIAVRLELDEDLPPIPCVASEIEQVLLNLLRNAAQAMAEAKVSSPVITMRARRDGAHALIEVEDNGPGIAAAQVSRVFEPFYTTKRVGEGTGLGLSVSYFIITSTHRGEMSVTSQPGQGSCFSMRLPLSQGAGATLG